MRSALSEIGGEAVSQIDLDTFFVGLLVTRVRQEWILEEALVDVVDDDGLPTANVVVVEGNRLCSGRSSSCMAIKRLLCASLCR